MIGCQRGLIPGTGHTPACLNPPPVNQAGRAFRPESAENEGESANGEDIPDVPNSPRLVELLKREGDNLGQMIASSREGSGKHTSF
jgi:hypothetical protein